MIPETRRRSSGQYSARPSGLKGLPDTLRRLTGRLSEPLARPDRINLIGFIAIAGFVAAVAYHVIQGAYLGRGYPFSTFLFRPLARFSDLLIFQGVLSNPDLGRLFNYPPFTYLVIYPFSVISRNLALFLFLSGFIGLFLFFSVRNLRTDSGFDTARNVLAFSFMSYPFLFALDRANFEAYVFVLLYLFVACYRQEKRLLAAVCLSVAISMKLYPAIFLLLPLSDRKYRDMMYTVGFTALFSAAGFLLFDGGLAANVPRFTHGLWAFNHVYVVGNEGWYCGSSLFGALKFLFIGLPGFSRSSLVVLSGVNSRMAIIAGAALLYYLLSFEKELWRKVALLVLAMILLPQVSPDYKLMHLFTPLFLFVNKPATERWDVLYTILFALLLIPKSYFRLPETPEASVSLLLNPLVMLVLAGFIIWEGVAAGPRRRRVSVPKRDRVVAEAVET